MFFICHQVIKELQEIAGINDGDPEDEAEELNALLEEANMPLQDIVANIKVCFSTLFWTLLFVPHLTYLKHIFYQTF